MSKLRLSIPSDYRQLTLTTAATLTTALLPSVENFGQAAADPAGIDGGNSKRKPGCAGWAYQVSDHDAHNQAGERDRYQGDYQNHWSHRVW